MPVYVRFTFHAYGNVFFIKVRKKNVRPVKIPNNSFIRFILKKKTNCCGYFVFGNEFLKMA